jgi:hypothetical protein
MFEKNVKTAVTFHVMICLIVAKYGPKYVGNIAANNYSNPLV